MKNIKLFSLLCISSFLMFQSCEKIKELLVITVNLPLSKCETIIAPQAAGEYVVEKTINNTKTQEILDENKVDASAIRSAAPNEVVVSIDNPTETSFKVTDFKSIKVVLSTQKDPEVTIAEQTIDNEDVVISGNTATFPANSDVELTEYLKETSITMKIIVQTSAGVVEDTKLCFELKNDLKIGLPE